MSLPENLDPNDFIYAFNKVDSEGIPEGAESNTYDIVYKGNVYPPKLIVSYANESANGTELDRTTFRGGRDTPAFKLIKANGFKIFKKTNIYAILVKFISQAKTDDLKYSSYPKSIKDLELKISFGQGNQARIPWISLLKKPNSTSNGIYPVYLYFKEEELLVLAYGVSETNTPKFEWPVHNKTTISEYFDKNNLGKPSRYGLSYVFRVYSVDSLPNAKTLENDLDQIIKLYEEINFDDPNSNLFSDLNNESLSFDSFNHTLKKSGLQYSKKLPSKLIASLLSKPFLILTGLSGSGKTKLAQAFVEWISQKEEQYKLVAVGADWTNREPLLGYPNALNEEDYVHPDSGVLQLIINANENSTLPYFLILDEMNLSHVERYFADFLSVMESGKEILLHGKGSDLNGVPPKLELPKNLFIIGTVNIDETTHMFSPKVLDRANTIEFRITKHEMQHYFDNFKNVDLSKLQGQGASMARDFLSKAVNKPEVEIQSDIQETLLNFFAQLKTVGAEFGYRTASEMLILMENLGIIDNKLEKNQKVDIAIMQKLLPKLHGSRRKLLSTLEQLGSLCVKNDIDVTKDIFSVEDYNFSDKNVLYPMSLEKISRMHKSLIQNGYASFAEA